MSLKKCESSRDDQFSHLCKNDWQFVGFQSRKSALQANSLGPPWSNFTLDIYIFDLPFEKKEKGKQGKCVCVCVCKRVIFLTCLRFVWLNNCTFLCPSSDKRHLGKKMFTSNHLNSYISERVNDGKKVFFPVNQISFKSWKILDICWSNNVKKYLCLNGS